MPVLWTALENLGHRTHGLTFSLPRGKLRAGMFHLLTLWSKGEDLWHLLALAFTCILPQVTRLCWIYHSSKTDKTEASFLGNPLGKVGEPSPFFSWVQLGDSGSLPDCMIMCQGKVSRCPESPYWFLRVWFYTHLECRGLSISFSISHKRDLFMNCCWFGVFVRGMSLGLPTLPSFWHHFLTLVFNEIFLKVQKFPAFKILNISPFTNPVVCCS